MTEQTRQRILSKVDNWKFWQTIFGFGLACVIVALYVLFGRTARDEAARAARQRSDSVQAVSTCFNAVKNAPIVQGFLDGNDALITNGLIANRELLARDTVPSQAAIHSAAIGRLEKAQRNAAVLRTLIETTTPTKASCIRLARTDDIPVAPYLHPKPKPTTTTTTAGSS